MVYNYQIRLWQKRTRKRKFHSCQNAAIHYRIVAFFISTRFYINTELITTFISSASNFKWVRFFHVKYKRYLSLSGCRSPPPLDFEDQKIQNPEGKNVTDHIDWNELLKKEDKLIGNSDRKHRYHFKSLNSMSEELLYQESMLKHQKHEPETMESEDFIDSVKDEKLANALQRLTPKQRKAVELAYWQGFKGREIAGMLGCTPANVSLLLDKALKKIQESLAE